ncbi:maleylpyruvate isomerase family mycothiol-dependent enzyme [Streptomyces sodiiphilus]
MSGSTVDTHLPTRLLHTEHATLLPLLRKSPERRFTLRTACPGWTVRDVLAHCAGALTRIVEDRYEEGFTPRANAADVAHRREWPLSRVLDELERGFLEAGPAIAKAGGELDVIALGEWVHAGDVRDAFGVPGAYGGESVWDALAILAEASRTRGTPRVYAELPQRNGPLVLGRVVEDRPPGRLRCGPEVLIRLYSGRPVVGTRYALSGAEESELVIYR